MDIMIEDWSKPEQKEHANKLRHRFFSVLHSTNDPGFHYRSLRKPDGVGLTHLGRFENPEALARFQGLPEMQGFRRRIEGGRRDRPGGHRVDRDQHQRSLTSQTFKTGDRP